MRTGKVFIGVVFAVIVSGRALEAGTIWDDGIVSEGNVRAAISGVEALISLVGGFSGLPLRADGDGGGSDGGDAGSSSDDTGTGNSTSTDSTSTDGADGPGADPDAAPTTFAAPTDPTISADPPPTVTPEMNAIMSIPTTDPRGTDVTTLTTTTNNAAGDTADNTPGAGGQGGATPTAPVDVGINAVIVSGAQSPWDAIGKVPGVGTVTVTGGIVALGTTPLPGEPPGGGPQPPWLRLVPDLNLLDGSVIPPIVPNVIDVRITRYSIEAVEKPNN